jgi:hypothetical protein
MRGRSYAARLGGGRGSAGQDPSCSWAPTGHMAAGGSGRWRLMRRERSLHSATSVPRNKKRKHFVPAQAEYDLCVLPSPTC